MDTGVIIAIIGVALILLAVLWFAARKGRERRYETRKTEAEAQAAEAKRQDALSRERAASADEQHREARERHIEAARKDPDADPDEAGAEFDRTHADTAATGGDQSVEHYERTDAPDMEHERRFERDEDGEVVRDEEYEQPRSDR